MLKVLNGRRRALVAAVMRLQLSKGKKERKERKGGSNNGTAAQPSGSGAALRSLLRSPAKNRSRLFSPTAFAGRFFAAPSAWSLPCFRSRTARRFGRCKVSQRLAMKRNAFGSASVGGVNCGHRRVAAPAQTRRNSCGRYVAARAGFRLRFSLVVNATSGASRKAQPMRGISRRRSQPAGATRRQAEGVSRARCRRSRAEKARKKS